MEDNSRFFAKAFALSKQIRYIAVYEKGELAMKQGPDLKNVSSGESDKYEELLVNPTLIKLASQRGNIDCGGLQYFIIRYGNFFVLLFPTGEGHVNFGMETDGNPLSLVESLQKLMKQYGFKAAF